VELETKPERTMKTKELEIEKKRVVDLEEQVVRPKVKLDPVLILITCGIFFFLFWTPFTLLAGFSVGAMVLFLVPQLFRQVVLESVLLWYLLPSVLFLNALLQ